MFHDLPPERGAAPSCAAAFPVDELPRRAARRSISPRRRSVLFEDLRRRERRPRCPRDAPRVMLAGRRDAEHRGQHPRARAPRRRAAAAVAAVLRRHRASRSARSCTTATSGSGVRDRRAAMPFLGYSDRLDESRLGAERRERRARARSGARRNRVSCTAGRAKSARARSATAASWRCPTPPQLRPHQPRDQAARVLSSARAARAERGGVGVVRLAGRVEIHAVRGRREGARARSAPGICHYDDSARVQTVDEPTIRSCTVFCAASGMPRGAPPHQHLAQSARRADSSSTLAETTPRFGATGRPQRARFSDAGLLGL